MANNSFNNKDQTSLVFSPKEKKLIGILGSINPLLSDILKGVVKVVSDIANPDRFRQAANSIRGITDILVRNAKKEVTPSLNNCINEEQRKKLNQLSNCFYQALRLMPVGLEKSEKVSQIDKVTQQYKELENTLKKGRLTQKQKLKRYFGNDRELSKLPEFAMEEIRKVILAWAKTHDYFVKLSHYDNEPIDEKEFMGKWQLIQDCLIRTLSPFFDETPLLDELLNIESPPNE